CFAARHCCDELFRRIETSSRTGHYIMVADQILQAARRADDVRLAAHVEADVAEVPGPADGSLEQPPIHHYAPAHARAEGEHHNVPAPRGGPAPRFAERRRVRVVEDPCGSI